MTALIETRDIRKQYRSMEGFWGFLRPRYDVVLHGATLAVAPGEILGLRGGNGAGKSTLLKIMAGILAPDGGEVRLRGVALHRVPTAVRRQVALLVSESRSFYWRLTCRQNLEFFASLWGLEGAERRARIAAAAERLDLTPRLDHLFLTLSAGLMQRMALARTLVADPHVWLLDEPFRDLDETHREVLYEELRRRRDAGHGAVLVSHDRSELSVLADRVVTLRDGRVAC